MPLKREAMSDEPISPQDAHDLMTREGYTYVDVRTEGEFANGHPEGAVNVPIASNDFLKLVLVPGRQELPRQSDTEDPGVSLQEALPYRLLLATSPHGVDVLLVLEEPSELGNDLYIHNIKRKRRG